MSAKCVLRLVTGGGGGRRRRRRAGGVIVGGVDTIEKQTSNSRRSSAEESSSEHTIESLKDELPKTRSRQLARGERCGVDDDEGASKFYGDPARAKDSLRKGKLQSSQEC